MGEDHHRPGAGAGGVSHGQHAGLQCHSGQKPRALRPPPHRAGLPAADELPGPAGGDHLFKKPHRLCPRAGGRGPHPGTPGGAGGPAAAESVRSVRGPVPVRDEHRPRFLPLLYFKGGGPGACQPAAGAGRPWQRDAAAVSDAGVYPPPFQAGCRCPGLRPRSCQPDRRGGGHRLPSHPHELLRKGRLCAG